MKADLEGKIRRFYKDVGVIEGDGGYAVALDGRTVRTPAKAPQTVPTKALAEALADEWRNQGEHIDASTMLLTKLVNTVLDRTSQDRTKLLEELERFAKHDAICYQVDDPPELARRQAEAWQPLIDWAATHLDAAFVVTKSILPVDQPDSAIAAIVKAADALDDWTLMVAHDVGTSCRSIIIGMAAAHGVLDAAQAFAASELEEAFQREAWGEDAEAMDTRARLKAEVDAAMSLLTLLRD